MLKSKQYLTAEILFNSSFCGLLKLLHPSEGEPVFVHARVNLGFLGLKANVDLFYLMQLFI